nr:hypothetical protein BaRGS_000161 [Batillaria attramentaria]
MLALTTKKNPSLLGVGGAAAATALAAPTGSTSTAKTTSSKKKSTKAAAKMIKAALDAAKISPAKKGRGKQASVVDDDGIGKGGGKSAVAAGGFTILSEKKLFLGQKTAAQIILQSIRNYFNTTSSSSLKQIFFVLYDTESVNIYTSELGRLDS